MPSQKARERKSKRREKIRKEHLLKAKRDILDHGFQAFCKTELHGFQPAVPKRDDRDGWSDHFELSDKNIAKKAFAMFPNSPELKRFFAGLAKERDNVLLSYMFTRAAQSVVMNFPFKVPYYIITGGPSGYQTFKNWNELEKRITPKGAAWILNDKPLPDSKLKPAFSTHAIERLVERLVLLRSMPEFFMHLSWHCGYVRSAFPSMFDLSYEGVVFGHCPYEVVGNLAVATSFLLPGMKGTPAEAKFLSLRPGNDPITVQSFTPAVTNGLFDAGFKVFAYPILPWIDKSFDFMLYFEGFCGAIVRGARKFERQERQGLMQRETA